MIKVSCLGATKTVTGSNFLIESPYGEKFLVDCGLFQGSRSVEKNNWAEWGFDPAEISALFLTHAHIDHSGRIPKLVKDGFKAPIYTTAPTSDLCGIMLQDSAHIQEMEADWQTRKKKRQGKSDVLPLYTTEDALESLKYFAPVERGSLVSVGKGINISFKNAGHILGSSILEIRLENDYSMKLVFSGDLGQKDQLIVKDPDNIEEADYVFMESTYGNRRHRGFEESKKELLEAIQYSSSQGEKVIIPAFAVERTQEILYILSEFQRDGQLPDIPVYLDSPLAIKATEIFRNWKKYYDKEAIAIVNEGFDPFDLRGLKFTSSTEESIGINRKEGPAIVIAGNGMATAGRIKHHLKHNLWRPGSSIVIVGFQAAGTTGRKLAEGSKRVKVFGEDISVMSKIFTIGGFSAHADQQDLLDWLGKFKTNPHVFLVHGEPEAGSILAEKIRQQLGLKVDLPDFREKLLLEPRDVVQEIKEPAAEEDFTALTLKAIQQLEQDLGKLKQRLKTPEIAAKLDEEDLERFRVFQEELGDMLGNLS